MEENVLWEKQNSINYIAYRKKLQWMFTKVNLIFIPILIGFGFFVYFFSNEFLSVGWIFLIFIFLEINLLGIFNYLFDARFRRGFSQTELENYQIIRRIAQNEIYYKSRRAFHSVAVDHVWGLAQRNLDKIRVSRENITELRVMSNGFHLGDNLFTLKVGVQDKAHVMWYPIKYRITSSELEEMIPPLYKFAKESTGKPIQIIFDNSEFFPPIGIIYIILFFGTF